VTKYLQMRAKKVLWRVPTAFQERETLHSFHCMVMSTRKWKTFHFRLVSQVVAVNTNSQLAEIWKFPGEKYTLTYSNLTLFILDT
jgi:hypothetical protein